jgi:hypothetical protein
VVVVAEFGADRVRIGVAGAYAGNVAELIEDVEGYLPGVAGLGGVAGGVVGVAEVIAVGGLGVEVTTFPVTSRAWRMIASRRGVLIQLPFVHKGLLGDQRPQMSTMSVSVRGDVNRGTFTNPFTTGMQKAPSMIGRGLWPGSGGRI